jgi:hypothetical protein
MPKPTTSAQGPPAEDSAAAATNAASAVGNSATPSGRTAEVLRKHREYICQRELQIANGLMRAWQQTAISNSAPRTGRKAMRSLVTSGTRRPVRLSHHQRQHTYDSSTPYAPPISSSDGRNECDCIVTGWPTRAAGPGRSAICGSATAE